MALYYYIIVVIVVTLLLLSEQYCTIRQYLYLSIYN